MLILMITFSVKADNNFLKDFYLGIDITANARGNESFGSGSLSDPAIDYKVEQGIQARIGYKLNRVIKVEFAHSKFFSNYKDFQMNSLAAVLAMPNFLGTKNLLGTKYNLYPSYELGITHDVLNVGASLNFEYSKKMEFLVSYRVLTHGLNIGGGSNDVSGYYLGSRYMF